MNLEDIQALLSENLYNSELDFWDKVCKETGGTLSTSQKSGAEEISNKAWFLNKLAITRRLYVQCFQQILCGKYYEAWCGLERIELDSGWLLENQFYDIVNFKVDELLQAVRRWQSIFPYKIFFSPAFLEKRVECSICRKVRNPWSDCPHVLGRVYHGRECIAIVTELDLLEISLVSDPVQKYSVALGVLDENGDQVDNHNYDLVRFVADRLRSPFDGWTMYWTSAYHPHHLFPNVDANDACPCESGRAYKDCCKDAPGILRPHAQIGFDKDPPESLPKVEITGYPATQKAPS
jgi:hypothetical protein